MWLSINNIWKFFRKFYFWRFLRINHQRMPPGWVTEESKKRIHPLQYLQSGSVPSWATRGINIILYQWGIVPSLHRRNSVGGLKNRVLWGVQWQIDIHATTLIRGFAFLHKHFASSFSPLSRPEAKLTVYTARKRGWFFLLHHLYHFSSSLLFFLLPIPHLWQFGVQIPQGFNSTDPVTLQ